MTSTADKDNLLQQLQTLVDGALQEVQGWSKDHPLATPKERYYYNDQCFLRIAPHFWNIAGRIDTPPIDLGIYKNVEVGAPTEQSMRDFIASHTNSGWLQELLQRIENS